jgi:F-type H+-transporting ATPase subunit delta
VHKDWQSERSIVATADQAVSGVSGRYASALFDLASEQDSVADTVAALNSFQSLIDSSPELSRLMTSPVFKAETQMEAINSLLARAKINGIAANFLRVMCNNRRLAAVPAAITALNNLVAEARGEVTAEVTSSEKLSAKHLADLKTALKSAIGSDVQLVTKVDSSILGGLIVKVGSRMMDNSLRTKLNSLKAAMKGIA